MRTRRVAAVRESLSQAVLNQFEPDIAVALIEFGKFLSRLDTDIVVFMARKSLCLYDVFLALGLPSIERFVTSDRVLDHDLGPFRNKRVALIDDTLIVGTTLAKTKRLLKSEANAKVTVHVFCVDKDWWCKRLITPDSASLYLEDQRLMTFCTAEVRAFSLLPRPYLVDFPLTRSVRIRTNDFQSFLSSVEWTSFRCTTRLQERNGIEIYSFLPSDGIYAEMEAGFSLAQIKLLQQ